MKTFRKLILLSLTIPTVFLGACDKNKNKKSAEPAKEETTETTSKETPSTPPAIDPNKQPNEG